MSRVLSASTISGPDAASHFFGSDQFVAISFAVLFHLIVIALLLVGRQENSPVAVKTNSIKVQIMQQASPVPEQVVEQAPAEVPPKPAVVEVPKPVKKDQPSPVIEKAKFAKKRVDEQPILLVETVPELIAEVKRTPREVMPATVAKAATKPTKQSNQSQVALPSTAPAPADFDSSQYFPVQKDAPAYPTRALDKGVQGSCTVRYTVNTEGRVENSEALSDCHPFFIKPSLEATKSFKYTPRMVDGKAVKVLNVKNSFQYRIE
jgi:protein TonB